MARKARPPGADVEEASYEVGYGKPPKHTQFKSGQSGNRAGRPKGTCNLKTDLAEELAERIPIREGDCKRSVSKQRGMVKQLMAKALRGDVPAAKMILGLIERLLLEGRADTEGTITAQDQAIVADFLLRHRGAKESDPETAAPAQSGGDREPNEPEDGRQANQADRSYESN